MNGFDQRDWIDRAARILARVGQTNAAGTFLNYFDLIRRQPDGSLSFVASQAGTVFVFNKPLAVTEMATLTTSAAGEMVIGCNTAHFIQCSINGGAPKNIIFTQTNLTANKIPKADSIGTITDSSISDNGTTVSTTLPVSLGSTLNVVGNFSVATNKFNVTATNGNTAIAGDFAIATNKFTVDAANGNTLVAGTFNATGAIVGASSATATKFVATSGISNFFKGAGATSAAALVPTGNVCHVTGTVNITSIDATGIVAGTILTLIFDDVLTFTDGNNLKLAGNFVTTTDDTITLAFDGTNFYEICRSVN